MPDFLSVIKAIVFLALVVCFVPFLVYLYAKAAGFGYMSGKEAYLKGKEKDGKRTTEN